MNTQSQEIKYKWKTEQYLSILTKGTAQTSVTRTSTAYNKFEPGHMPSWIMETSCQSVWSPEVWKMHHINIMKTNLCDLRKEANDIINMQRSSFAVDS
jgi:hypothetical protein